MGIGIRQRLLKGGAFALAGKLATALLAVLLAALLARLLSPRDLGAYFLIASVATVFAAVAQMGLNHAVVRFSAQTMALGQPGRARAVVQMTAAIGVLAASSVAVAYATVLGPFIGMRVMDSPLFAEAAGLGACWIALLALQALVGEAFRGFHDIARAALHGGLLSNAVAVSVLAGLWWFAGGVSLSMALTVTIVAMLSGLLIGGLALGRRLRGMGPATQRSGVELWALMWPAWVASVTMLAVRQADLWVLGAMGSEEAVALYGSAVRIAEVVSLPLYIVNAVVPPLIAELHTQGRTADLERMLRATASLAAVPALLMGLGFIVGAGDLLGILFGTYYQAGAWILVWLTLGHLANVLTGSCGLTLLMTGHQRPMMLITAASGLLLVVGAVAAARMLGAAGVAAAVALTMLLQNLAMALAARRLTGVWTIAGFGGLDVLRLHSKEP